MGRRPSDVSGPNEGPPAPMKNWGTSVSGISQRKRTGERTQPPRESSPLPPVDCRCNDGEDRNQPAEEPEEPEVGEDGCLDQVERAPGELETEAVRCDRRLIGLADTGCLLGERFRLLLIRNPGCSLGALPEAARHPGGPARPRPVRGRVRSSRDAMKLVVSQSALVASSGVSPPRFLATGSAPFSISSLAALACPRNAAPCSAVEPSLFLAFTSAPRSIRSWSVSVSPRMAAQSIGVTPNFGVGRVQVRGRARDAP